MNRCIERRPLFLSVGMFLLALGILTSNLFSQVDTGSILGSIKDQTGASVPNATVTLRNEGTGLTLRTTSNGEGVYQFPALRTGEYTVTAEASGFAKVSHERVTVRIQENIVSDFTLRPGAVSESVEVTGIVPQLQTQDASVGGVVGTKAINDLPLNGRNYTFLAQLNAGVTVAQQDGRGLASSGTFAANGTPSDQNNYLLDGIDNNSNLTDFLNGNSYVYKPSVDALSEFKVQTSNYSAEFGRAAGAVLNATVKSGTDHFHGTAYEFFRNSALDAANFFENSNSQGKGEFRMNQFGASLGGPIAKDKTFFFADYEGSRIRQAIPYVSSVPTAQERSSGYTNLAELISGQSGSRTDLLGRTFKLGQVFDPATTRTVTAGQVDPVTGITAPSSGFVREPFAGNVIPAGRLDPNAVKLMNSYPPPNLPGLFNNYASDPVLQDRYDQGDIRVDQVLTQKDQIFGRFSYSEQPTFVPVPFNTIANGGAFNTGDQLNKTTNNALSWTRVFAPTLVNEARAGYTRVATSRLQPFASDTTIPGQFGIQGIPTDTNMGGLPTYNIAGLTQLGASPWLPTNETNYTFQMNDNLTKIAGKHTFKAGFEFQRVNITFYQPAYPRGQNAYAGTYTEVPNTSGGNTGLAQLLLTPIRSSVAGGYDFVGGTNQLVASNIPSQPPEVTRNYFAGYFQDDWKVTPNLTLNLGLRYDFFGHGYSPRMANFLSGNPGTAEFLMTTPTCKQNLSPSFLSLTAKDGINIACADKVLFSDKTNFAPRVGIAYHLAPKFVIRTGFGIFYGTTINGDDLVNGISYPFSYNVTYNNPDAAHPITYPNGLLGTLENGLLGAPLATPSAVNATGLGFTATQYNFHTPYSMEYNFMLQYQMTASQTFSVGYVGTQGRRLQVHVGNNSVRQLLPLGLNAQNYIMFPDFARGGVSENASWGTSDYNGLQTTFERRFSGGLQFLANYTWSKCRSDARSILSNNVGGYRAPFLPGFGLRADYALCDYDIGQVFHASGGYALPFGHGHRFLGGATGAGDKIVGGWQVNAIFTAQGGQPTTIGCPTATSTGLGCYAFMVPGQDPYAGPHDANHFWNPAAFAKPPAVTSIGQTDYTPLGGAPSQVFGPGLRRMDLSLFKQFPIREHSRLEFRAEVFNLSNTPAFSLPGIAGPSGSGGAAPGATDFTNINNFGKITSTRDGAYDQREIQFALKLYW
jgi:hypothetical protein